MPDLKRVCFAAAAVALLAAIAGGQQTSPFRQPPIMPPEIAPGNGAPPAWPHGTFNANPATVRPILPGSPDRFPIELDNAQMRVTRFTVPPSQQLWLPLDETAPGVLLVALADSDIEIMRLPGALKLRMAAGSTRWIEGSWVAVRNAGSQPRQFLAIETKQ
jgi:hypothetical protein